MSSELEKISSTMLKALDEGRANFAREFEKQTKELDEMREKFAKEMEKETKEQEIGYAKLMKEREALEKEKIMIHKISGKASDVIKINVGGRQFTTKRSTITQVENSLLAKMFSGTSGSNEDDEKQDCVFLDLDPDCFAEILIKLREQVITGKKVPWELVPGPLGREKHFVLVLRYLGLLPPTSQRPPILTFASEDNRVKICSSTGRFATNVKVGYSFARGGDILSSGDSWGLKINHIKGNQWLLLGIIGEVAVPLERSYADSTCYGWAAPSQIFRQGKTTGENWPGFSKGDRVTMMIGETDLKMKVQRLGNKTFTIKIPANSRWRVHVNFYGLNDSVELVQEFEEMS